MKDMKNLIEKVDDTDTGNTYPKLRFFIWRY